MTYDKFFTKATGIDLCYPYQKRLAIEHELPDLLAVPTGAGKTAATILGWIWRRRFAAPTIRKQTATRMVYCLPMRVLVEQTRDCAVQWLERLGLSSSAKGGISVNILIGGEADDNWDLDPDKEQIIAGTQDMLLSRALNRGYGMSRARWPMHFALLNNDCLWVLDEVQLMGSGLATTAQLDAFRRELGTFGTCKSLWMSATLSTQWLETIDFKSRVTNLKKLTLGDDDRDLLKEKLEAAKDLAACPVSDPRPLAAFVREKHLAVDQPNNRTLVVLNTVDRAVRLYKELADALNKDNVPIVLLHSRFRLSERQRNLKQLLGTPPKQGLVAVATQVVEAGADFSSAPLFTDIAPWASLVQRFGRCNRYGECNAAHVYWINLDTSKTSKQVAPYEHTELSAARERLLQLKDVRVSTLLSHPVEGQPGTTFVLRRKDVIELFDTTPDLAGNDTDISRFIRDTKDHDAQVFWRELAASDEPNPKDRSGAAPRRDELCRVPVGQLRKFVSNEKRSAYQWDFLDGRWNRLRKWDSICPGYLYLLRAADGGYSEMTGWDQKAKSPVNPVVAGEREPDANDRDAYTQGDWQSIAAHSDEIVAEIARMLSRLPEMDDDLSTIIKLAARWHDRGKAHHIFQEALPADDIHPPGCWAKANGPPPRYKRKHFRHELASALAVLSAPDNAIPAAARDVVAYLAAAHHGKVRLSIRSMPDELRTEDDRRFARGIWEGDKLPKTDLGSTIIAPAAVLDLEIMELGLSENGEPSWIDRMLELRDSWGVFRLAFLEAVLRAADMRVSARHSAVAQGGGAA